ncbi:dihydroxyacetone kinase subunit DhaL [Paenilisteria rocourtiae]|uniref:phosphoenolpyruvate--glycerone phosphotransferase n=1 Tax=Listeria rocourtiae TaxID=647910 RepID=A0A4R6ZE86_9LIST|nr:dihydroxyacetone kinase subunit DhaL [Listeria rocourtiae]EUJ47997.1 dihydroxyacetone kinase, L subunit [Listeria rocourtiae FSL F6-920]MBC1433952.1 dihydroxyacetone kinase subunit L [Listeria rocourtiae]MBC1606098.1 dihydroxyacetone kinase subunit L [Listeria rocourtiae]TDR50403.1 dihydroxyacetone kinase DhaL subunit [Listeria rocourtiae]
MYYAADFRNFLNIVTETMEQEKEYLCELDRKLGDGDHGVTMSIGWQAIKKELEQQNELDCSKLAVLAGKTFLEAVGSSVGPLYATGFLRGAKAIKDKEVLSDADLTAFWLAFMSGVKERGQAEVGDKTMIDTLEPARIALEQAFAMSGNFEEAFRVAIVAAEAGMVSTIDLLSKRGRSSRLGDRSLGNQDPGATSAYLILTNFLVSLPESVLE